MYSIDRSAQRYADRQETLTKRRLKLITAFGVVGATLLAFGDNTDSRQTTPASEAAGQQAGYHTLSDDCLILGAQTVVATGEADTNGIGSAVVTHTDGVNWYGECYDETLEWVREQNGFRADNFHNSHGQTLVVPEKVIAAGQRQTEIGLLYDK